MNTPPSTSSEKGGDMPPERAEDKPASSDAANLKDDGETESGSGSASPNGTSDPSPSQDAHNIGRAKTHPDLEQTQREEPREGSEESQDMTTKQDLVANDNADASTVSEDRNSFIDPTPAATTTLQTTEQVQESVAAAHDFQITLPPGAYHVIGPGFRRNQEGEEADDQDGNVSVSSTGENSSMVFEGFLPEPTRRGPTPQERAQEMLRSAITLDDSAVRKVDDDTPNTSGSDWDDRRMLRSPLSFVIITALTLMAIALGVSLGHGSSFASPSCPENFQERFEVAKTIASNISSLDTLDDSNSPQNMALEWITCQDIISSNLIDERDPSTGLLPKQTNGFKHGGDSGEAHILRRYALAVFYFSTLEQGPWKEQWNFLSPELHECSWHENKTRSNWPFGDFDPAGLVCTYPDETAYQVADGTSFILLDDTKQKISHLNLNFRIPNNLAGTLPPEFGYLEDVTIISLESQTGLYGSLPSTLGNMRNLYSFSILFGGPEFGGVIPSSLFSIPTLEYVTLTQNEGVWEFPTSVTSIKETILHGIKLASTGLSGTVPPFLSKFTNLTNIDFSGNSLEGTIPESFGRLTSLEFVSLYDNKLNGTLPDLLGQLTNLTVIGFGKNNFQGSLPHSLGHLHKLLVLDLSYNELEGTIPNEFSELSNLKHISLQHNANLHGSISPFGQLKTLSSLLLYSNNFNSTIPQSLFSNFSGRIFADFGHNNFTGKLPEAFSRYAQNTSYLAIMSNNLDSDAVDDAICAETSILHADCSSCPCCESCCTGDSVDKRNPNCYFDLDFYKLAGLECGLWWSVCHNTYYDPLPLD